MKRVGTVIGMLVLWACASGVLMVTALLSVSSLINIIAICACAVCLLVSCVFLSLGRNRAAFAFASGPAFAFAALAGVSIALGFIDQWLH